MIHKDGLNIYDSESKVWFLNDEFHREDGPAVEMEDGTKEWFVYGVRHRVDGPAIECPSGYKEYIFHGKCHREDGPAREWGSGYKEWFLDDVHYKTQEDFERMLKLKAFW